MVRDDNKPLICIPTRYFGRRTDLSLFSSINEVLWTDNPAKLPIADAVLVHIPDFKFRGRIRKYPRQIWAAWSLESGAHYPVFNDVSFMQQFDITMTYRRSSTIWANYLPSADDWRAMAAVPPSRQVHPASAAMFVSSGFGSDRRQLIEALSTTILVDSYGARFHNRDLPLPDRGRESKISTWAQYPFALALENAREPDYVTEKIFDAFWAGAIPVYLGASNVADFVPAGSYIDASTYPNGRALGGHLAYLAATPGELAKFHAWRKEPLPKHVEVNCEAGVTPPFARLARTAHETLGASPRRRERPGWQVMLERALRFV